jgi:endonuclease/exonuclease/phosphatase family metal-dependent hydrolase
VVLLAAAGRLLDRALRTPAPPALPAAPAGVTVGVPARRVRVAAYNVYQNYRGMDRTVGEVRKLDPPPDFLLLSEIRREHVRPMAEALGMPHTYYPPLPHVRGQPDWPDVAILSKYPLHDGRPLSTEDGQTFGLLAFAVVEQRKFAVAGVHMHPTWLMDPRHVVETAQARRRQLARIDAAWREAGTPPLVIAGDFNQVAMGENYEVMTRDLTDTLAALGQTGSTFGRRLLQARIDYVLASREWEPLAGGVIAGTASDHRPVWVDLHPRRVAATTRASTKPAGVR